jgi:hypothetical protein
MITPRFGGRIGGTAEILIGCISAVCLLGCAPNPAGTAGEKLPVKDADNTQIASTGTTMAPNGAQTPTDPGNILHVGGGTIELSMPDPLPVSTDAAKDWLQRAATAVSQFYGRYPVKHVDITILSGSGGRIQGGQETQGRWIRISLGRRTRPADLTSDWTMTHEMFHLSQPQLDRQYSWMSEGMADYLEPVARVRIGQITPEKFWKDLVEGLPQGLPEPGDQGLDRTPTWARTYWGGCLYWFLADIRVREQTHNHKSVRDAARAVLDAGGDGAHEWTMERLLATYDRGSETTVFKNLHDEMGTKAVATDLDALWKSLGVKYTGGQITFDDTAPLAAVRQAVTMP